MSKDKADPGCKMEDLIDANNKALFEEVNAIAPIQLIPSTNGQWGGVLSADGKSSMVVVVPTAKPSPIFAHELLHIKLELVFLDTNNARNSVLVTGLCHYGLFAVLGDSCGI